jgi:hypothetical protein
VSREIEDGNEAPLYAYLKSLEASGRLEQEKIPQWYVEQKLYEMLGER